MMVFGNHTGNANSNSDKIQGFGWGMVDYVFCLVGHCNGILIPGILIPLQCLV
jgi:hypothetical protein